MLSLFRFSQKHLDELLSDAEEYLIPELINVLNNLRSTKKIRIATPGVGAVAEYDPKSNELKISGKVIKKYTPIKRNLSRYRNPLNKARFGISQSLLDNLLTSVRIDQLSTISNIIHELVHAYDHMILKNNSRYITEVKAEAIAIALAGSKELANLYIKDREFNLYSMFLQAHYALQRIDSQSTYEILKILKRGGLPISEEDLEKYREAMERYRDIEDAYKSAYKIGCRLGYALLLLDKKERISKVRELLNIRNREDLERYIRSIEKRTGYKVFSN